MSMPIRVTILSRENCHLCDVVYRIAIHLQSELHIETSKMSIDGDQCPDGALWDKDSRRPARRG